MRILMLLRSCSFSDKLLLLEAMRLLAVISAVVPPSKQLAGGLARSKLCQP